jgi:hypothetical protein
MPSILPITKKNAYCKIFVAEDIYRFMRYIGMFNDTINDDIYVEFAKENINYKFNSAQIKELKKDFNKIKNGDYTAELKHFEVFYEIMIMFINCSSFKKRLNLRLENEEQKLKDGKINEDEYLQKCSIIKEAFDKGEQFKEDCMCNIVAKYRRGNRLAIMVTFLPCCFGISYDNNDENNDE